jgi:hypothetical protein
MRCAILLTILICRGTTVIAGGSQAEPRQIPLSVEPSKAQIGLFYDGVDLTVSADTEPGVEVAVLATGPSSRLVLRETARRWGLFWAPAGEVVFEDVPSLYLLRTSAELGELASEELLDELGVGYEALGPRAQRDLYSELIRLKESEQLFSSSTSTIQIQGPLESGRQRVKTEIHIPPRAPEATYSVRLFGFRNRGLVATGEATMELGKTDFLALVSSLAEDHGLAYGILAVTAALAAGLVVGLLFGSAGRH